jgi:hypothetical protein
LARLVYARAAGDRPIWSVDIAAAALMVRRLQLAQIKVWVRSRCSKLRGVLRRRLACAEDAPFSSVKWIWVAGEKGELFGDVGGLGGFLGALSDGRVRRVSWRRANFGVEGRCWRPEVGESGVTRCSKSRRRQEAGAKTLLRVRSWRVGET